MLWHFLPMVGHFKSDKSADIEIEGEQIYFSDLKGATKS